MSKHCQNSIWPSTSKLTKTSATYLSVVLEDNDSSEIRHALGMVARARGMTEVTPTADIRLASRIVKNRGPLKAKK